MRAQLSRLPLDAWDALGALGLGLLAWGVWEVYGRGAAAIATGALLLAAYAVREANLAALIGRNRREG